MAPLERENGRGVEGPDRGGKAVFKVQIVQVVVKLNGAGCG